MKNALGLTGFNFAAVALSASMACLGVPAAAQNGRVLVPSLPLEEALKAIAAKTGVAVEYDPDAVVGLTSLPVNAADAKSAVRQATRTLSVAVRTEDGRILVTNDILVIARRDEAEDNLLVRNGSTSTRTGQSLRDQARNTQVLSSKLIARQQAQTVADVLRNAGGVSVNTATLQSGVNYSVRGFASGGIVNGLPGAVANAGLTQPVANIERVEVLKGPDALLSGQGNMGGTINIVTKKPSAETLLYVSAEAGSFGQYRLTGDANRALNEDRTISARVIAAVAGADRNYGGYRGTTDFLFAPSVRFKNASTDLILSASVGEQSSGPTPFVPLNTTTNKLFDLPRGRPLLGVKDQGVAIDTTQFNGELTQQVTRWLTLVGKAQHQKVTVDIAQYNPFFLLSGDGTLLVNNEPSRQQANADAIDAYARVNVRTGPIDHTLVAGYTYTSSQTTVFSGRRADFFPYNFVTEASPSQPLAPIDTKNYEQVGTQGGYYAQYLANVWKLHLSAGVRHNKVESSIRFFTRTQTGRDEGSATTPNFGAVVNVTGNLAVFGTLAYGYQPTFVTGRDGRKLPDVRTRNAETGVKLDLFGDRVLINASYFKLRQSNLIITDPSDFAFPIAVPGMLGTGIDLNVSGEIVRGWSVQGSYTRTKYENLTPSDFGNEVVGQPKDLYSVYTSYHRAFGSGNDAGVGAGLFGRSSAAINRFGAFSVPSSLQVDLNGFLKLGRLDANLGFRNVFDRRNYGISYTPSYVPITEPRSVRLTLGYRFQ